MKKMKVDPTSINSIKERKSYNNFFLYSLEAMEPQPFELGKDLQNTGRGLQSHVKDYFESFLEHQEQSFLWQREDVVPFNFSQLNSQRSEELYSLSEGSDGEKQNLDDQFLQTDPINSSNSFEAQILKEQPPQQRKKNGNIPKFICRTACYKFSKYKKIFKDEPKLLKEMTSQGYQERKKYFRNKNANNTIKDVRRIFVECEGSSNPKKRSFLMRKMLNSMLRTLLKEEVINNQQIELKKEYLISLKTQALRCRNSNLMCRLKSK